MPPAPNTILRASHMKRARDGDVAVGRQVAFLVGDDAAVRVVNVAPDAGQEAARFNATALVVQPGALKVA